MIDGERKIQTDYSSRAYKAALNTVLISRLPMLSNGSVLYSHTEQTKILRPNDMKF